MPSTNVDRDSLLKPQPILPWQYVVCSQNAKLSTLRQLFTLSKRACTCFRLHFVAFTNPNAIDLCFRCLVNKITVFETTK